jgi:hypothetical protein
MQDQERIELGIASNGTTVPDVTNEATKHVTLNGEPLVIFEYPDPDYSDF